MKEEFKLSVNSAQQHANGRCGVNLSPIEIFVKRINPDTTLSDRSRL